MIKILHVDDDSSLRELVKAFLEMYYSEINVTVVDGALEALSELERSRFDLIISDYNMPEKNGLEFLGIIRSDAKFRDMPFILYTSVEDEDFVYNAIKKGATFVHTKGGNPRYSYTKLVCMACRAIQKKRSEKEGHIEYELTNDLLTGPLRECLKEALAETSVSLRCNAVLKLFIKEEDILLLSPNLDTSDEIISLLSSDENNSKELFNSIVTPIKFKKSTFGVITIFRDEKFSDQDSDLLILFAGCIAAKIMEWISRSK